MNANDLVKYIYDNDKIKYVLENLDCVHISERTTEFRCGLPNDTSRTRVRIKKNEYLNITIFQANDEIIRGNIITLTMNINNCNFISAIKFLHNILNLRYSFTKQKKEKDKKSPIDIFNKVIKHKKKYKTEIKIYENDILNCYIQGVHINWYKEGILPFTAKEFNLGYDIEHKRVVIPHSKWDSLNEDKYIGIMGRTTIKNYDLLDIPKYFPLIPFSKGLNLYGLKENYKTILEKGYVVIHEAEKSVLKRHSVLDKTGVALCCHDFDERGEQVKILIGLNVDIIICMDKGVSLNHIRSMCERFYNIRNVYYVWDKYDILKDKEAPADKSNKIYNILLKQKIKYDEKERNEYFKWLEKQKKN